MLDPRAMFLPTVFQSRLAEVGQVGAACFALALVQDLCKYKCTPFLPYLFPTFRKSILSLHSIRRPKAYQVKYPDEEHTKAKATPQHT